MALPANADVRGLLARIRVDAEWRWKGGAANDASQVRWDDTTQREPTELEYLAEQAVVDAETVTKVFTRAGQRARVDTIVGLDPAFLTTAQVRDAVEELMFFLGSLDDDGLILPVEEWGRGIRKRFNFP